MAWTDNLFLITYSGTAFDAAFITDIIEKALHDFQTAPLTTSFVLILPNHKNATWYSNVKYFDVLGEIATGTDNIFSTAAPSAGGDNVTQDHGRVVQQQSTIPLIILYKDLNTVVKISPWLQLHLENNHAGPLILENIVNDPDSSIDTDLRNRCKATHNNRVISCPACAVAKCRRPKDKPANRDTTVPIPTECGKFWYMDFKVLHESKSGYRYCLGLICKRSGYNFTYYCKTRPEVYSHIHNFCHTLVNKTLLPLGILILTRSRQWLSCPTTHCQSFSNFSRPSWVV